MRPRLESTGRTIGDIASLALFALVLVVPLGGRSLDPDADRSVLPELRQPAPLPPAPRSMERVETFPGRFKAWVDDCFAFRSELVRWHNALLIYSFGVAPSERSVLGPNQWVFTTANKTFEAYRGTFKLSQVELEQWRLVLEARRDWLAAREISYVFCFAPAKPTLYPEQLPAGYRRGEQTTLEQLRAYLEQHSDFELLDLHTPLLAGKQEDTAGNGVYYQLGTHWTERGGFVATRAIFGALQSSMPALQLPAAADYGLREMDDAGDSWAGRFHVADLLLQQRLEYAPLAGWRTVNSGREGKDLGTRTAAAEQGPRLVLLHDSFGEALFPFLAEQFSESFSHGGFEIDPALIELVHPDVLVQVMAERRLESYPPRDALSGVGAASQLIFDSAPHHVAHFDDAAAMQAFEPWEGALLTSGASPQEPPLEVQCRGGGQGVLLPRLELPPGSRPLLRLELTSNVATELSVLFKTASLDEYAPSRSVPLAVQQGRNKLQVYLPTTQLAGQILLLPRRRRGRYELHSVEVRATD